MEPEPDQQRPGSRQGDERGFTTGPSTNDGRDELKVVYLRDHQGVRYVFPYELCRSKEACILGIFDFFSLGMNAIISSLPCSSDP
jgi:hypothetical protein